MVLLNSDGALSVLSCAVSTSTPHEARIFGTEGSILIHSLFWMPKAITLKRNGQPDELIELPYENNGYQFEAIEVDRCLREGKTESDLMPLDETVTILETMDRLRAQWGLRYPGESVSAAL
jgi:predicted dehydrogenase